MMPEIIRDYKMNLPLNMLEIKYKIPIHEIINILYEYSTRNSK